MRDRPGGILRRPSLTNSTGRARQEHPSASHRRHGAGLRGRGHTRPGQPDRLRRALAGALQSPGPLHPGVHHRVRRLHRTHRRVRRTQHHPARQLRGLRPQPPRLDPRDRGEAGRAAPVPDHRRLDMRVSHAYGMLHSNTSCGSSTPCGPPTATASPAPRTGTAARTSSWAPRAPRRNWMPGWRTTASSSPTGTWRRSPERRADPRTARGCQLRTVWTSASRAVRFPPSASVTGRVTASARRMSAYGRHRSATCPGL